MSDGKKLIEMNVLLTQREGQFEGITVSRSEYAQRERGQKTEPFRPRENAPLLADYGSGFQRETSTLSDYGPKSGEKAAPMRPTDSELFRVSKGRGKGEISGK